MAHVHGMDWDRTGRNGLFLLFVVVVVARNTGVAGRRLHVFLLLSLKSESWGLLLLFSIPRYAHTRRNWAELESDGMGWDGMDGWIGLEVKSTAATCQNIPYLTYTCVYQEVTRGSGMDTFCHHTIAH